MSQSGNFDLDLSSISDHLRITPEGIWISNGSERIFYPDEGNENCLTLESDSFWFEHRSRCIQLVVNRFPPPGPLFDVGGGNGYVALGLQDAGIPVVLLEPGWSGIQNARKRKLTNLILSTLEDAGFHDATLPAVGLFDVLEHIFDDKGFLETIYRLLSQDGRLYLTVPAYKMLWSAADDYAGHQKRYTLKSLSQVLTKVGFRVEYSSYLFFMLPLPVFFMRVIPSRLGIQKPEDWRRYQQEHASRPGTTGRILAALLDWELARIRKGEIIPMGGSCLVVAGKNHHSSDYSRFNSANTEQ